MFKPERIHKCATLKIDAPIEQVFPLFGPIREKDWAEGWNPEIIFSSSNLVEEHMIFQTKAHNAHEQYYTWAITKYDEAKSEIEYTVSTQNRIWFIQVVCRPDQKSTLAEVCYTYTGLNAIGDQLNREALEKMFSHDLKDWEDAINHYLKHGKLLKQR